MMDAKTVKAWLTDLFSDEEDPNEPAYDPVHVGGVVIISMAGIGGLYWLLWTLLVFEGGLFVKLSAAAQVLFTSKTLRDFGYVGSPYEMGVFEGWVGNLVALVLCGVVLAALYRIRREARP